MSNVTLGAAQALRAMGYSQTDRDGMMWWRTWINRSAVWSEWECDHFEWDSLGPHTVGQEKPPYDEYIAAPDELDALRWCAGLGYYITVIVKRGGEYYEVGIGVGTDYREILTDSADEAIIAIAEHHAQHAADAGKGK